MFYYLQDCHGPSEGNGRPTQDDTQNYIVESGYQNGTHTKITFRRPLETCDPHDLPIGVSVIIRYRVHRKDSLAKTIEMKWMQLLYFRRKKKQPHCN
jgi:hypothetical protein